MGGWYPPGGSRVWSAGFPTIQAQGLPGRRELYPLFVDPRIDALGNHPAAETTGW